MGRQEQAEELGQHLLGKVEMPALVFFPASSSAGLDSSQSHCWSQYIVQHQTDSSGAIEEAHANMRGYMEARAARICSQLTELKNYPRSSSGLLKIV